MNLKVKIDNILDSVKSKAKESPDVFNKVNWELLGMIGSLKEAFRLKKNILTQCGITEKTMEVIRKFDIHLISDNQFDAEREISAFFGDTDLVRKIYSK